MQGNMNWSHVAQAMGCRASTLPQGDGEKRRQRAPTAQRLIQQVRAT